MLTYLSGLTCTHANVMDKGEYRRVAAELGIVVVCPDTSPRGEGVPNDEAYDFGQGAGLLRSALKIGLAVSKTHFNPGAFSSSLLVHAVCDVFLESTKP